MTSTNVNFRDITLGDLIKDGYNKFNSGDTPNGPSNYNIIDQYHNTDNGDNTSLILTKLSKRENSMVPDDTVQKVTSKCHNTDIKITGAHFSINI